jgi:hypothetical protein
MNVFVLEHGFVLTAEVYLEIVKTLDAEIEEMVASLKTKKKILSAFETRKKGLGAFVQTAEMIRLNMVPLNMRHLINMATYHEFGKKEFNLNFCDAVKSESIQSISFMYPSFASCIFSIILLSWFFLTIERMCWKLKHFKR